MFDRTILTKNIDSFDDVDIPSVKLSDLTMMFRAGCSKAKGFGPERVVVYRAGISCNLGNVESTIWLAVAEAVVIRELGEDIFEKAIQFVRDNGTPLDIYTEATIREAALNICTGGAAQECYRDLFAVYPELEAVVKDNLPIL